MTKPGKLAMRTPSLADEHFAALTRLFPNVITEAVDENGVLVRAVDADALAQEINSRVVSGKEERYQFTWPDKRKSVLLANAPIAATLRPCREESVNFDSTENLYIEGDNLDVLKLIRETYLNRVKVIYIDPPYNTTGNFVYKDDFSEDAESFLRRDGQFDEQGNRLFQNMNSNGRFHTDWLNMLHPRLRVARDLLSEDGVIFIHIDDNEIENLGKICNEIFGADNFINIITVKTKVGGVSGSSEGKSLQDSTEFIWVYAKNKNCVSFNPVYIRTPLFNRINSYKEEGKSWKYTSIVTRLAGRKLLKEDRDRKMKYYGYSELETMSIAAFARKRKVTVEDVYNQFADRIFQTTNAQSSVRQTVLAETAGFDYPMYGCEYAPIKGKNKGRSIEVLYKGEQRRMMMYLSDAVEKIDGSYHYLDKVTTLWDDIDYNNLTKEGDVEFPNGKKPIKLLMRILSLASDRDSLILDFFSGSASLAHAAMQLNSEDGGNRRYILVQLPEPTGNPEYPTICEIGKERIRRAGAKIKQEPDSSEYVADTGFRVLKLDSSNMNNLYYTPEQLAARGFNFDGYIDNIKSDRTGEDLLFQIMLDLGISLSAKVEQDGKIFRVSGNQLIASFEPIDAEGLRKIAQEKPAYAVFRDSSFSNDSDLVNFEQVFNTYSPQTICKVL